MTVVKICGLRTTAHALTAAEAGADLLGFIFAPARRRISVADAAQITAAVRASLYSTQIRFVGVFVNETPAEMRAIASHCGLDMLQLSGDEPAAIVDQLGGIPLLKAVRLNGTPDEAVWLAAANEQVRLLVDAHVAGSYGGAGIVGDWGAAAELARQQPILLAGGLHPANVAASITAVSPWGVDVSSGVETDGVKDSAKIQAFIAAVRAVATTSTPGV
ncbi:MAG TPA: phosphoribosylanthranilate isomerase [Roseiflexaceae bacterium]|nr:phosphoribosylanthranilate isomerase [Roseiflexaceae bacterium]